MKKLLYLTLLLILFASYLLSGTLEFKQVGQWKHDYEIYGRANHFSVDKDNHLVGSFFKMGPRLITPDKVIEFAPRGQGPNELMNLMAAFMYNGDLAVLESREKLKIFEKKDGTYKWKETRWFKRGYYAHMVSEGIYFDNKFFLSGHESESYKNNEETLSRLKVLSEDGKILKTMLHVTYNSPQRFDMMKFHLVPFKSDRVFFMAENELNVIIISSKELEVLKEVKLEVPPFYKKMPKDFYIYKKYSNPNKMLTDIENWTTGYSRITEAAVSGDYLVLQLRTCNDKMKKFALLFYNTENFKLEKTIFIDDYLLAVKDGKFYFFAGGNPGRDEDAETCIINIYSLENKK